MITINDEILKNLKTDLEKVINESIIKLYENSSDDIEDIDVATVTANIKIALANSENEVTGKVEKVPLIKYETKYKIPEEVKQKGEESTEYQIHIEDEEIIIKKREKAQISVFDKEEKKRSCNLSKTKYQDIQNCKNRKNDSCEECKNYN